MKKGGDFEAIVAKQLDRYGAAIRQVSPPVRILRWMGEGKFHACYEKSGALDFAGCVSGAHVEFDCKDVKGKRFDFNKIRDGQMEWATSLMDAGAVVGWLVRFRAPLANDDQIWYISHLLVCDTIEGGKSSINIKRLAKIAADDKELCRVFAPVLFGRPLIGHFQFLVDSRLNI